MLSQEQAHTDITSFCPSHNGSVRPTPPTTPHPPNTHTRAHKSEWNHSSQEHPERETACLSSAKNSMSSVTPWRHSPVSSQTDLRRLSPLLPSEEQRHIWAGKWLNMTRTTCLFNAAFPLKDIDTGKVTNRDPGNCVYVCVIQLFMCCSRRKSLFSSCHAVLDRVQCNNKNPSFSKCKHNTRSWFQILS